MFGNYTAQWVALYYWGASVEPAELERLLGGAPRISVADIVGHPRLAEARKLYLDRFLTLYSGDPFLVRLLIEAGRFLLAHLALILDAVQDPARRETWLTVGLLKQTMALFGVASDRHIDDLIARLCAVGYLEQRVAEQDRRMRLLQPTDKLRAHDRAWLAAHYAPLTVLYPQYDYAPIMQCTPQFHRAYRRISFQFMAVGAEQLSAVPETMMFFRHAAGYPIVATLLRAAMERADDPHAAVPYVNLGDQFGVSRTHVRKLFAESEQAGLLELHGRGGHKVTILPRMWAVHDRGIAGGMYVHDMVYVAALRFAQRVVEPELA